MVTLTKQADLQKIPISFKHRGQLVPDNIDGHLNIQVPISAIGQLIQNIREEHESNKKKEEKSHSAVLVLRNALMLVK